MMEKVKKTILVGSGKGGVGKSTVAVGVAKAYERAGLKVGILDADLYGPNVPKLLGYDGKTPEIMVKEDGTEMFVPPKIGNILVMSMSFLVDPDQALIWRGPKLHEAIRQFTHQIFWGELDLLIIDLPPGTGDIHLSLAQSLKTQGVIVVTSPQNIAIDDVRRSVSFWKKVRVPILGVVENFSYFICPHCDKKHALFTQTSHTVDLIKNESLTLLGEIPLERPEPNIRYFDQIVQKLKIESIASAETAIKIGQFT